MTLREIKFMLYVESHGCAIRFGMDTCKAPTLKFDFSLRFQSKAAVVCLLSWTISIGVLIRIECQGCYECLHLGRFRNGEY